MPEFLKRRYSPAARWYLSVISVIGYVLTNRVRRHPAQSAGFCLVCGASC